MNMGSVNFRCVMRLLTISATDLSSCATLIVPIYLLRSIVKCLRISVGISGLYLWPNRNLNILSLVISIATSLFNFLLINRISVHKLYFCSDLVRKVLHLLLYISRKLSMNFWSAYLRTNITSNHQNGAKLRALFLYKHFKCN